MDSQTEAHTEARVLIVEDDPVARGMLEDVLGRNGYACTLARNSHEARELLGEGPFALVLCDIVMPGESGLQLARHIIAEYPDTATVMVTALDNATLAETTLAFGAHGYLIKPFRENDLLIAVANALARRRLEIRAGQERELFELRLAQQTEELRKSVHELERTGHALKLSQNETIERLTRAIEFRSRETSSHMARTGECCALLGRRLGLDPRRCEEIRRASGMHDIGKVALSDRILLKAGPLTPEERTEVEQHTEIGYEVLTGTENEVLQLAATIALSHHEWFDGTGYPGGLSGEEIPLEGRMAAVADCYDALTHIRPYRPAFTTDAALDIMRSEAGTHFDPKVLEAMLGSIEQVFAIERKHAEDVAPSS